MRDFMDNFYTNLWNMCSDISRHAQDNDNSIISSDDPKRLIIGFLCTKTNKQFQVRLTDTKHSKFYSIDGIYISLIVNQLFSLINGSNNRKKLADFLNHKSNKFTDLVILKNRLIKLKAFY